VSLDPCCLLRGQRIEVHDVREQWIGRLRMGVRVPLILQPAIAGARMRIGVGDVGLEVECITGVPSSMSASQMCRVSPSTRSRRTTDIPIGLGRCGERVANTPLRPLVLRGGRTLGRHPSF
jgi:hypothetical protein